MSILLNNNILLLRGYQFENEEGNMGGARGKNRKGEVRYLCSNYSELK